MELRKDPITRSWVITGDDVPDSTPRPDSGLPLLPRLRQPRCSRPPFCREREGRHGRRGRSSIPIRSTALKATLRRRGDGLYDRMRPSERTKSCSKIPATMRQLWNASDVEIAQDPCC